MGQSPQLAVLAGTSRACCRPPGYRELPLGSAEGCRQHPVNLSSARLPSACLAKHCLQRSVCCCPLPPPANHDFESDDEEEAGGGGAMSSADELEAALAALAGRHLTHLKM